MSDKIVNHFVLADGSTAKYDANELAGDIVELADIRVGADGTTYANAGSAVREQFENETKSLIDISEGKGIKKTYYEIGGLRVDGQDYNISYRVRMKNFVSYPYPITYKIADGYRYSMYWKDTSDVYHDAGWLYGDYTVPANALHRVVIGAYPEDTSATPNIDTFVSALSFNSYFQYKIVPIEANITKIKTNNEKLFMTGDGLQLAEFEIGSIAPNGDIYDGIQYRIRAKNTVSYPYPVTYSIRSGYRFAIHLYNDGAHTDTGWINFGESYTVASNTPHKVVIGTYPEDTSATPNIEEYSSQLHLDSYYQSEINVLKTSLKNNKKTNCKIISHKGWKAQSPANTIPAFIAAAELGFKYAEVDFRPTSDNVFVLSHDDDVTLYKNNASQTVKISETTLASLKEYTWDASGEYPVDTLMGLFTALKPYDMVLILDIKSGDRHSAVRLANLSGMTDKIILSYNSIATVYNDISFLKKYDYIPVRVVPAVNDNFETVLNELTNTIYADVNVYETCFAEEKLPIALAYGLPIIFSGCTETNAVKWSVLAAGVMANYDLDFSINKFLELMHADYSGHTVITASKNSISLEPQTNTSLSASASGTEKQDYIYGYCENMNIAQVAQMIFGNQTSFDVYANQPGTTNLVLFTGNGSVIKIPIEVNNLTS